MPRQTKIKKQKTKSGLVLNIYDLAGREKESASLPKEIFAKPLNQKLLSQYVHVYLANQRQGTASTKTRGEVTGSTRKIYRQKGTGRARHGDIKAPIFVGGGIVGGPKPRDYSLKLNKVQKKQALFSALSLQNRKNNVLGLSKSALKMQPKTKAFAKFLKNLKLSGLKILLVLPKMEKNNLVLAARNISGLVLTDATSLNAYEILRNEKIIMLDTALEILKKHFLENGN